MKKLVVFLVGLCLTVNGFSTSSKDDYKIPMFIQEVSDEQQQDCKGMSAKELGVDKILKCLTISSKGVSIIGQNKASRNFLRDDILLAFADATKKSVAVLKKYPLSDVRSDYSAMSTENLLSAFPIDKGESLHCVIFQYVLSNMGRQIEESKSFADFFILSNEIFRESTQMVQIAESRISSGGPSGKKFLYGLPDSEGEPAQISNAKILTLDENRDGFQDIVIWKKNYISREIIPGKNLSKNEKDYGPAFVEKDQQLLLMRFNPEKQQYEAPISSLSIPTPDEKLWNALPTINKWQLNLYDISSLRSKGLFR